MRWFPCSPPGVNTPGSPESRLTPPARQEGDQPADLGRAIVSVRADADPPGALVDDDALSAARAREVARVRAGNDEGHDPRAVRRPPAAEDLQAGLFRPGAQVI